MSTLGTILKDNWAWRKQIGRLALFELVKKSRGAVLSWSWFFIKPAMYIFCFWFALDIGLRVGSGAGEAGAPPYILWLCAGLIPWFFMQDMLGAGIDVMHRYPYLVNKIKFPLSGISTIFTSATMLVQLMLMAALFVIYFACGMSFAASARAVADDVHILGYRFHYVQPAFGHQQRREEPDERHVHAVFLAFRRHLQREECSR